MPVNYFHATSPLNLPSIIEHGLILPFVEDDEKRYPVDGILGHGVYISRDWKTALWFNTALLRVQLKTGTRILETGDPPEMKSIDSLRRELGAELLRPDSNSPTDIIRPVRQPARTQ